MMKETSCNISNEIMRLSDGSRDDEYLEYLNKEWVTVEDIIKELNSLKILIYNQLDYDANESVPCDICDELINNSISKLNAKEGDR